MAVQKTIENNEIFLWKANLISIDDAENIAHILGIELELKNSSK